MKLLTFLLLIVTGSGLSAASWANQETTSYYPLISEYVYKVENYFRGNWTYSYTVTDLKEGESRTIFRDLTQAYPDNEKLVAVNGELPNEAHLARHQKELEADHRRRQQAAERMRPDQQKEAEVSDQDRFLAMINEDSVRMIKREGNLLYLEFTAMEEDYRRAFEHLVGTLILDTEKGYIKELQVRTTDSFSPFFLTHIEDAFLSIRLSHDQGVSRIAELSWQISGQAFFIKNLDSHQEVVWSNIEPKWPEASSVSLAGQ